MTPHFDYSEAFSRNIGWITVDEQKTLRKKRIAIAGMGGVGGVHLLTLVRLGIGAFNISDLDQFELVNFNRQSGAMMSTLGRSKAETLAQMALDINPDLDIRVFSEGISLANVREFLSDADLYVDGMDFFAFKIREALFSSSYDMGIHAITAAPLGMGSALLNFKPGGITFEEYFDWEGLSEEEMAIHYLIGISPGMLQFPYLVDQKAVNLSEKKGPSTAMACQLCAGMLATEALKVILNRGKVLVAPWGMQFDAYRNRFVKTWRPGGNRNPIQRLLIKIAKSRLEKMKNNQG